MKKQVLGALFLLLAAGWFIYGRTSERAAEPFVEKAGEEAAVPLAAASVRKAVEETEAPAPRRYSLPEDVKQEELLETLLAAVAGNVLASSLEGNGWENDWDVEGSDTRSTKTFSKSNSKKDKVTLHSFLARAGTGYVETVLSGSLRKCHYPSQDALIGGLREEGFTVLETTSPVHGFGSAYWTSVRLVRRGGLDGLIYYESPGLIPGCAVLVLTDGKRADALYTRDLHFLGLFTTGLPEKLLTDLQIVGAPGVDLVKVGEILASTGPLYAASLETLARAWAAAGKMSVKEELVPALSVFKGYLALQIFSRGDYYEGNPNEGGGGKPFLKILEENGLKYAESHYGGIEPREGFFDVGVYERYPDSYWGQFSFLLGLDAGFSDGSCYYGLIADRVIERGSAFIKKHPDSAFRADALFLLGQAYETLYNQGFSQEACSPYSDKSCKKLVEENEANREKTAEAYRAALAAPGGDKYRGYIESVLPRLAVRGKTYCHKYFPRCD